MTFLVMSDLAATVSFMKDPSFWIFSMSCSLASLYRNLPRLLILVPYVLLGSGWQPQLRNTKFCGLGQGSSNAELFDNSCSLAIMDARVLCDFLRIYRLAVPRLSDERLFRNNVSYATMLFIVTLVKLSYLPLVTNVAFNLAFCI